VADAPEGYDELNQYTRIIVDEALRRGISVEVVDPGLGELVLSRDGRRVTTIESLSELTSAVAFRRCDDKLYTRRVLQEAGLRIPAGRAASFDEDDAVFLEEYGELVVKPARGEGGDGVTVGIVDRDGLDAALASAKAVWPHVVLEQRCEGEDLRVIVIDGRVVAASVRRPPTVTGDGSRTVRELVEELTRSRAAETDGAATIPLDEATLEAVRSAGHDFDAVIPAGEVLAVRGTANVHTGGTIEDVTEALHPDLAAVAVDAAEAIDIPVVGLDFIVTAVDGPEYLIIEANEQPGLANHEPQPTAERFLDLLFPESARTARERGATD
jgi:GNAT-family acetyltransferase (TIGR03103 family)